MNIALIIQESHIKNLSTTQSILIQEGWTYSKEYKELDKDTSFVHLYPLVISPQSIERGELTYISSLIYKIRNIDKKTRRYSL